MITVVLVEPEHPSNIGALARVMANFGFRKLILINPKCNHLDNEAILRAKHSSLKILKNAKVADFSILNSFDTVIGTSAIESIDYNVMRSPLNPEQMKKFVTKNTAIVFGREGKGLKNNEIAMCDFILKIPTSKEYRTMNISHSAAVILYEISKTKIKKHSIRIATKKEKDILLKEIKKSAENLEFSTKEKKETQIKVWKRVIGKALITRRELQALFGFFKKIKQSKP